MDVTEVIDAQAPEENRAEATSGAAEHGAPALATEEAGATPPAEDEPATADAASPEEQAAPAESSGPESTPAPAAGDGPPPAGGSAGGWILALGLGAAAAGAVFIAAAEPLPLGPAAPYLAALLVFLLAAAVQLLAERRSDRAFVRKEEQFRQLLESFASEEGDTPSADEPLAGLLERARQQLKAALDEKLRAREEEWRREARHDLVRARSQCEVLVEKHVERVRREKEELEKGFAAIQDERKKERQAWETSRQDCDAELVRRSEAAAHLEQEASRAKEKSARLAARVAELEGDAASRVDECGRVSVEVERLLEEVAMLRKQRARLFNTIPAQVRGPLQMASQLAEDLLKSLGSGASTRRFDAAAFREKAAEIHARSAQIGRLMEQLVDYCRLESASVKAVFSDVDLQRLVEGVAGEFNAAAKAKGLDLSCDLPKEAPLAFTDARLCGRILRELVANAVQFTDRGGRIRVAARLDPAPAGAGTTRLRFEVADTGRGIAPQDRQRVFLPFERLSRDPTFTSASEACCGLGLTLVRSFARLLGGDVDLESEEGKGSTFRVTLPVKNTVERPGY